MLAAHRVSGGRRCKVRIIQEFSVWWTDRTGGTDEFHEQFYIWYKQRQWDHDFDSKENDPNTFILHEAPAPLAYFYAQFFANLKNPKHRHVLEDLYGKAMYELTEHYDVIFYLPAEFSVPEGDRLRKRKLRREVDTAIVNFLSLHKIPFVTLSGNKGARARKAFRILKKIHSNRPANPIS